MALHFIPVREVERPEFCRNRVGPKTPPAARCNVVSGLLVPMPTFPPLVTIKLVAVEEPTIKAGPVIPFGFTDKRPQGEVVPMPIFPAELKNNVDVAVSVVPLDA